ncbi:MAG: hypothetical protein GF398_07865 [Chitinivibrionales bacterium]|nr:hypothetical protein [Chitinivibrionales bacterium]
MKTSICMLVVILAFQAQALERICAKKALALNSLAYYELPSSGMLPAGYVDKWDTCLVESTFVDSLDRAWFGWDVGGQLRWANSEHLRYLREIDESRISAKLRDVRDKIRRLKMLKQHPGWPRRIMRAVRNGQICLHMDSTQLKAAWGNPYYKSKAFMLGMGEYEEWVFQGKNGVPLTVAIGREGVIGWTKSNYSAK